MIVTPLDRETTMFSWFKRKPPVNRDYSAVFDWPHERFADLTEKMVEKNDPNGRMQLLIALKNLSLIHQVFSERQEKIGKSFSIRDIVERNEEILAQQKDEIASYRLHWFCQASYILRCIKDQGQSAVFYEAVLNSWIFFLESHHCLQRIVMNNAIWSDDEKSWFKPISGRENESLMLVAMLAPDNIASDERFIEAYRTLNEGRAPWPRRKHEGHYKTTIN